MCAVLCLFCEFFLAFRASDGDFAFALGDTDGLLAFGAGKITVVFVANSFNKLQIFAVFPVSLIGVAGKAAVQCQNHKAVGNGGEDQPGNVVPYEQVNKAGRKSQTEEQAV